MSVVDNLLYKIDLLDLANKYTDLHQFSDGSYRGICPIHKGSNTSSFAVYTDNHYYCFSCGAYGNAIDFYCNVTGLAFYQAVEELCNRYEVAYDDPTYQKQKATVGNNTKIAAKFHSQVDELAPYLTKRGITKETIDEFNLGYDKGGFMNVSASGLVIPIQDAYGRIIGFSKRRFDEQKPKYKNTSDSDVFHKGDVLFNYNRAVKRIKDYNCLHVVEGYMDAISAHQQGLPCVGYMSAKPTKAQILLLKEIQKRFPDMSFILAVDNPAEDDTGRKQLPRIRDNILKYAPMLNVRCVIFPKENT